MNNPELYKHNNGLQKKEAIDCLELYANKLKWIDCCKIMDIGCGDGGTTMNILKRYLPPNFTQLIGCDKNIKMIEFAKEHHCDERTIFIVQDIEHDLRSELKNEFGHVFSFTALQWITDNRYGYIYNKQVVIVNYNNISIFHNLTIKFSYHVSGRLFKIFMIFSQKTVAAF